MSGPILLASRPLSYWRLHFAIIEAAADWREAPWYGPWNIAIHTLFQDFCPSPFVTITYPQYPVTKDIDSVIPEEDECEDSDDDDEIEGDSENKNCDDAVASLLPRNAPSPDVYRGFRQDLPMTPPNPSPPRLKEQKRKKRSTRIPDFVQLVFKIRVKPPNNSLVIPAAHIKRIILLVEIKRAVQECRQWSFVGVLDQTDQQAHHAFASYPEINTLGVIIALGNCWTYREYNRHDMESSPTLSELKDLTYRESYSRSPSIIFDDVHQHFGARGFARLQESASDAAFRAIHRRLQTVCMSTF